MRNCIYNEISGFTFAVSLTGKLKSLEPILRRRGYETGGLFWQRVLLESDYMTEYEYNRDVDDEIAFLRSIGLDPIKDIRTPEKEEEKLPIIVLSGPMSGIDDYNRPAFDMAAARFRAKGYTVVNPANINPSRMTDIWGEAIGRCLSIIRSLGEGGNVFYLVTLPGYSQSPGCQCEVALSVYYGAEIIKLDYAAKMLLGEQ